MKMKKTLSLLLALVLSLGLLAGCGGDSNDQPAQNDTPQQEDTTTPPADDTASDAEPAPTEDVTIQVAALASGYEEAYPGMWQEVCDAFTAATGIKVDLIVDKALEDVIGPSMQGGEFPDVIHLATGREKGLTEQFIKDRNIADITDVLSMTVPGESVKVSDKIVGGLGGAGGLAVAGLGVVLGGGLIVSAAAAAGQQGQDHDGRQEPPLCNF